MFVTDHDYHVIEMVTITSEMVQWCQEQLGETGRYVLRPPKIFFLNERDHLMFLLKFGS